MKSEKREGERRVRKGEKRIARERGNLLGVLDKDDS